MIDLASSFFLEYWSNGALEYWVKPTIPPFPLPMNHYTRYVKFKYLPKSTAKTGGEFVQGSKFKVPR